MPNYKHKIHTLKKKLQSSIHRMTLGEVWIMILVLSSVFFVVVVVWSVYLFFDTNNREPVAQDGDGQQAIATIDRQQLVDMVEQLDLREVRFDELTKNLPPLPTLVNEREEEKVLDSVANPE